MNDEMDVSDSDSDERSLYKKRKFDVLETNSLKVCVLVYYIGGNNVILNWQSYSIVELQLWFFQDENDSLRCQLEAYKNEICVVRSELQCDINRKNDQIAILQKTLNTLSQVHILLSVANL